MKAILKKEVTALVKAQAKHIVSERIVTETFENVTDWTGNLLGKLTNLDAGNVDEQNEVYTEVYNGLLEETIAQLQAMLLKK